MRVMRRQWSTTSDMLERTMSGTPRLATLPTEPESTQTWYPRLSAMRADSGSKILAAREQLDPASTLRNFSLTRDTAATSVVARI